MKRGVVQHVAFTQGGAGNQWTTIDGVKYATWWDFTTKDWRTGDTVTYETTKQALWHGNPPIDVAHSIKKAKE